MNPNLVSACERARTALHASRNVNVHDCSQALVHALADLVRAAKEVPHPIVRTAVRFASYAVDNAQVEWPGAIRDQLHTNAERLIETLTPFLQLRLPNEQKAARGGRGHSIG